VQYKFSLIFITLYIVIFNYSAIHLTVLFYLLLAVITSIGIAGLGYMLNDYKDLEDDIKNNKRNIFIQLEQNKRKWLAILFLALAAVPWLYFPFNYVSLILLLVELLLFYVYAFPPFRLKEKGFLGIICDSLYAQAVPCTLAAYTFYQIETPRQQLPVLFIVIGILWFLIIGIRNILVHQIEDYANDANTQTQTFVRKLGKMHTIEIIYKCIFPVEFFLFLVILQKLPDSSGMLLIIYLLFVAGIIFINKKALKDNPIELTNKRLLNEFYEIYLPVLLLLLHSFDHIMVVFLIIFHLLLFFPVYYNYIKKILSELRL
jgi:4-hydroxybenzoate polyprenyltransferase